MTRVQLQRGWLVLWLISGKDPGTNVLDGLVQCSTSLLPCLDDSFRYMFHYMFRSMFHYIFISYSTLYEAVPCSILGMAWGYQREPGGKV